MPNDYRQDAATYYDRFSGTELNDVTFYRERLAERATPARVLELGCGTGRVIVPLAPTAARSTASTTRRPCCTSRRRS